VWLHSKHYETNKRSFVADHKNNTAPSILYLITKRVDELSTGKKTKG